MAQAGISDTAGTAVDHPAWLPAWLEDFWSLLANYPALLALVIVLVGFLLAFLARGLMLAWGLKLSARIPTDLAERTVRLGAGVVFLIMVYLSLVAATESLDLSDRATMIITRMLVSLLILQLMRVGLRASHLSLAILSRLRDRFSLVEERTIPLFDLMLTILVVAAATYALLMIWNIDATAWLASAGIIGLVVGIAARDTLANLFAGFSIIADAPYKLGDYIVLDTGERGEVTKVGIRATRILTRDDVEVTIPNSVMGSTKVVNESGGRWVKFRIRLKVGVAYGSDVDQVVEVLERVACEHKAVVQDPAPRVRLRAFGDSSLDFELLCWVNHPSERGLITHEIYMNAYKILAREGITIPFPQRDVWMRKLPDTAGSDGENGEP